jgi:hypothetical protein
VPRGEKVRTPLPSIAAKPSPQPENSQAEKSKNLGLEVVQFMGSPAGLALGTVAAGLLFSWLRRRAGSGRRKTGSSPDA